MPKLHQARGTVELMNIDPSLIRLIGSQLQNVQISEVRAREIASEVEVLLAGLDEVLPAVDFFDEPDSFRAALWALRGTGAEAHRAD